MENLESSLVNNMIEFKFDHDGRKFEGQAYTETGMHRKIRKSVRRYERTKRYTQRKSEKIGFWGLFDGD